MVNGRSGYYIHRVATAVPGHALDQAGGIGLLKQGCTSPRNARMLERIARLTGIERRYLAALAYQTPGREDEWLYRPAAVQPCGPGMTARTQVFSEAAEPLVLQALGQWSGELLAGVDALVTVSCTHAGSPGLEHPILTRTSVPPTVDWWNLGFMGCSAALAAVRLTARAECRRALVVACELSSLHFQYTDHIDQMTANVLFADGLAAMMLSPEPSRVRVVGCKCVSLPQFAAQMIWRAGDHGLQLELAQDLPDTLAAHLPAAVEQFLNELRTSRSDIDHWLVHPGGPQILDAAEQSLSLRSDALGLSRSVLRDYGNMSSPTILFILQQLLAAEARGAAMLMAFGPGLTIELVLLELG